MKPRIVCLCGSTRFKQEFILANFRETMAGRIVLSVGWFSHADAQIHTPTEVEKQALDELHLCKIDLADEVFVINCKLLRCKACEAWWKSDPGMITLFPACDCRPLTVERVPYIGESTRREITYAEAHGKPVRYLEFPCT